MQNLIDKLRVIPQYLIPQHFLSYLVYKLTRSKTAGLKNFMIRIFKRVYQIDIEKAVHKDIDQYVSFNQFFTRAIDDLEIIEPEDIRQILSPATGTISQFGTTDNGRMIQAKGRSFRVEELLVEDNHEHTNSVNKSSYITIYLAPSDYHRIHMPFKGRLLEMRYVPGDLFAVNHHTTRTIDNLFARNERVICKFENPQGIYYLVMVGAIFVGNIETVWAGEINSKTINTRKTKEVQYFFYNESDTNISFECGEEIGRFNMGSTVILVLPNQTIDFSTLVLNQSVQVGDYLGKSTG